MFEKIIKRDGSIKKFDASKITNAIAKAGKATGEFSYKEALKLTIKVLNIASQIVKNRIPTVEEIQDIVEEVLLSSPYKKTAKAYILYRDQHRMIREISSKFNIDLIDSYLTKSDWKVKENSNMSFSLQGLNNYISQEITKTYWLNKLYPQRVKEAHENGNFHIHDLGLLSVYTYYGKEVIIAKINGIIKLISFEKLYDLIENNEELLNEKEKAFAKYPDDIYVLDRKGWVKVKRIIRKKKNREMRFIKNRGGRSVIVTDNHPMITEKDEKIASRITEEDKLFTVDLSRLLKKEKLFYIKEIDLLREIKEKKNKWQDRKVYFNGIPIEEVSLNEDKNGILHTSGGLVISRKIKLTEKFGYFVGLTLAEGYLSYNRKSPRTISLVSKNKKLLLKANKGLLDNKISGYITKREGSSYELQIKNPFLRFLFREVFKIKTGARNKTLPIDSLLYNKKFVKGMISGLIDGDGSIETSKTTISLRISSRTMLEQLYIILSLLGFTPRDRAIEGEGTVRFYKNRKIIQNYPLYGISFRKIKENLPSEIYRKTKLSRKAWHDETRDSWHTVLNNKVVNILDKVIYDITTESGTLIVNGMWNHNCVGWDLLDLLSEGFKGAEGKIESKPAKHFHSILGQIVNFFYTLQGEASGAQAFSNFDTLLSPFIYYDGLNYKEVKQALQEFIFNCNVPTRVGFQTPFTNITLDLNCPSHLANQPVIIGGKPQNKTYKEFKKEQDMFNKALLEVMLEGDAKGRIFTFPIPTYNITKDFDWDNENLNILWEVTAKYGIPYFANFVNSDMRPEDVRSMCLHPNEELVIRKKGEITKTTIGKLVESEAKEFDSDGWSDTKSVIEVPSLNPDNYRIEWVRIKRFLKVKDNILITVRTVDGKKMRISQNHLVAIYTPSGIKTKLAKNLEKNDILLTTRKAQNIFKQSYQTIGTKKLDEKLGYLVGFFVADGNYLYDSRYEEKRVHGIQFNFNTTDQQQQLIIKKLVQDIYDYELKFIQDPRYKHSLRGYLYQTDIAKEWIAAGIEKYNNIPKIIFNSPLSVIQVFLEGFFRGDGYRKGKEIHINDEGLARDLVILMTLAGVNCTYRKRENSQVIRIQHTLGRGVKYTNIVVDTLYNRVPQFLVRTSRDRPFYNKNVMVCKSSLDRREAHTEESIKILNSEIALVKVESIKIEHLPYKQDFYDIELEKNHYFVHSLGNITHNCCRLRIDNRKLEKRGGGLFGASPLTGSIGVVTINMPRIGYLSKTEKDFFERLEYLMELAKESLEIKRKILERLTENNLYPYSKFYLRNIKKRFNQYWKNHFSTIGLIGMNEACINFLNKDIGTKEGQVFALRVLDFMRDKLLEFQKETNNNYNLEATPAEGASFRLAKIDKEKFPQIICANEEEFKKGAFPFYTNSTHLPVNYTDDIFEVLKHQDSLQTKYTGGTVLHIYIGESIENPQIIKKLVRKICQNFQLPYFTITPTFSICPQHGYISGEHKTCPDCGAPCEIYSRVVGYLRPVSFWNDGKREEFKLRKTFKIER